MTFIVIYLYYIYLHMRQSAIINLNLNIKCTMIIHGQSKSEEKKNYTTSNVDKHRVPSRKSTPVECVDTHRIHKPPWSVVTLVDPVHTHVDHTPPPAHP